MSFRSVFIAVVIATALIVSAFLVNRARPRVEMDQPSRGFVRATGKCAECHIQQQYLDRPRVRAEPARAKGGQLPRLPPDRRTRQEEKDHHGFTIVNEADRRQLPELPRTDLPGVPAQPACRAVVGGGLRRAGLQPRAGRVRGAVSARRHAAARHPLTTLEGASAAASGCAQCHSVGKPNADGTIGTCTACHTRHTSSVAIARLPTTCGQCHMGPDHSQLEIYDESKHGVMFHAQEKLLKLDAPPKTLTTRDMFVPTCATCHMSGLNGAEGHARPVGSAVVLPRRPDHEAAAEPRSRAGSR